MAIMNNGALSRVYMSPCTRQTHKALFKALECQKSKSTSFSTTQQAANENEPALTFPFSGSPTPPDERTVTAKDFIDSKNEFGRRTYQFKDEELGSLHFPSVTTVLDATMPKDNWFRLNSWKKSMIKTHGEENFKRIQKQTVNDGSNFHKCLENVLKQQDLDLSTLSEKNQQYMTSVQHILADISNIRVTESVIVHSELGYSGTTDCAAEYRGELCVIDWKTSGKPKKTLSSTGDNPVQVAAYAGALNNDHTYPFKVYNCMIVVVYPDGSPANALWMNTEDCEKYWTKWLIRLNKYRIDCADDLSDLII